MDPYQSDAKYTRVSASNAQSFVEGILVGNGVLKENATVIPKCLVQADLRGVRDPARPG